MSEPRVESVARAKDVLASTDRDWRAYSELVDAFARALDAEYARGQRETTELWVRRFEEADRTTRDFYGPGETRTIRLAVTQWLRVCVARDTALGPTP